MRHLILICILFPVSAMFAQSPGILGWESDGRPGVRIAGSWQQKGSIEIGMHLFLRSTPYKNAYYGDSNSREKVIVLPEGWWNAGVALEFPFGAGQFVAGPKLFTELNFGILSGALNLTAFIPEHGSLDFRVTPEIGIGLIGFLGVRYGYNWAPAGAVLPTIGEHRITLFIVLVKPRIHEM